LAQISGKANAMVEKTYRPCVNTFSIHHPEESINYITRGLTNAEIPSEDFISSIQLVIYEKVSNTLAICHLFLLRTCACNLSCTTNRCSITEKKRGI
jgi:hypothetical protein